MLLNKWQNKQSVSTGMIAYFMFLILNLEENKQNLQFIQKNLLKRYSPYINLASYDENDKQHL